MSRQRPSIVRVLTVACFVILGVLIVLKASSYGSRRAEEAPTRLKLNPAQTLAEARFLDSYFNAIKKAEAGEHENKKLNRRDSCDATLALLNGEANSAAAAGLRRAEAASAAQAGLPAASVSDAIALANEECSYFRALHPPEGLAGFLENAIQKNEANTQVFQSLLALKRGDVIRSDDPKLHEVRQQWAEARQGIPKPTPAVAFKLDVYATILANTRPGAGDRYNLDEKTWRAVQSFISVYYGYALQDGRSLEIAQQDIAAAARKLGAKASGEINRSLEPGPKGEIVSASMVITLPGQAARTLQPRWTVQRQTKRLVAMNADAELFAKIPEYLSRPAKPVAASSAATRP